MKIQHVVANNRKHVFEVDLGRRGTLTFPYAKAQPPIPVGDRVVEVYVDPELGDEGFTWRQASGVENTVHVDAVLEYNSDPAYMSELALYQLTIQARELMEGSGLSRRELARRLSTSVPQLYRLLDPANKDKSMTQLVSLIYVLGRQVEMRLTDLAS